MARMMKPPAAALPLRAVLADDERLPREQLRAALARVWPELQLVGEASHGAEALSLIERLPGVDAVVVDAAGQLHFSSGLQSAA
mgnify:CR=1 FL=1